LKDKERSQICNCSTIIAVPLCESKRSFTILNWSLSSHLVEPSNFPASFSLINHPSPLMMFLPSSSPHSFLSEMPALQSECWQDTSPHRSLAIKDQLPVYHYRCYSPSLRLPQPKKVGNRGFRMEQQVRRMIYRKDTTGNWLRSA